MAYSNLQRHYSVHSQSYIDGVPFRITDAFKPPPEVKLPNGFSIPSQTLVCTYDFRLEDQVIEWAESVEKAKQQQEQEKLEAQRSRSSSSSSLEEDSPTKEHSDSAQANNIPVRATPLVNFGGDSILTPIKAPEQSASAEISNGVGASDSTFDYRLFERESDPFDSLELKTIDDIAELQSVLQPQGGGVNENNSPQNSMPESLQQRSENVSLNQNMNSVTFNKASSSEASASMDSGILAKPKPTPRKSQLPPLPANKSLTGNHAKPKRPPRPNMPPSKSSSATDSNGPIRPPSYDSIINDRAELNTEASANLYKPKTEHNIYSRHSDERVSPRNGLTPLNPPPYSEEANHRLGGANFLNCGGYPGIADISNLPRSHSSSDQSNADSEPWNRYTPLPPTPVMDSPTRFNGPYDNLTTEQQQYVDSMTAMGFQQDSVIRLVEKFGAEQKVLDMLCLINQISESGYKKDDIETALVLLDSNEEKMTHYLEALVQLRNMGFHDTKITEALVESDLDVDKALDHLMA